jgi:hypothetical protein
MYYGSVFWRLEIQEQWREEETKYEGSLTLLPPAPTITNPTP